MIALSTGSLYTYGVARVFELAAEAGYDGIEVLVDHRWDGRHPAYLRRLSADYGMPILVVHSPFVVSVPGWPDDQLGRLHRTVNLAQEGVWLKTVGAASRYLPQHNGFGRWWDSRVISIESLMLLLSPEVMVVVPVVIDTDGAQVQNSLSAWWGPAHT